MGNLDINVYSSSSPGLSGSICPMADMNGLYFSNDPEPQNQEYELCKAIAEKSAEEGYLVVDIGGKDALKYYDARYKLMKECQNFAIEKNWDDGLLHLHPVVEDYSSFI